MKFNNEGGGYRSAKEFDVASVWDQLISYPDNEYFLLIFHKSYDTGLVDVDEKR